MYLRKSRADAEAEMRGEGETLARHEKILMDLAKKQRLSVIKIYKEIVSGETISSRPIMQKLLTEVESGKWQGVLVVEVERLARGDTIDQGIMAQAFTLSNTKIITPTKTYDPNNEFDNEYFEFGLFMSRREYKTINRRLQRGRIESTKEGNYLGSIAPFGYDKDIVNGKHTLKPNKDSSTVKLIFDMYTSGKGVGLIVRKLNELELPTAKGGHWSNSTITTILRNVIYTGKVKWNHRKSIKRVVDGVVLKTRPRNGDSDYLIFDGNHEAIVPLDQFQKAQQRLKQNPSRPCPRCAPLTNPLAGIVKCAKCNRNMTRRPYGDRQLPTIMCPSTACKNVSSKFNIVESTVIDFLKKHMQDVIVKENEHKQTNTDNLKESLSGLELELLDLKKRKDKLHDFLESGIYTAETYIERSKVLDTNIKQKKESISRIQEELANSEYIYADIVPKLETIVNKYESLSAQEKNDILKETIVKIIYEKNERFQNPLISIYPRIR